MRLFEIATFYKSGPVRVLVVAPDMTTALTMLKNNRYESPLLEDIREVGLYDMVLTAHKKFIIEVKK